MSDDPVVLILRFVLWTCGGIVGLVFVVLAVLAALGYEDGPDLINWVDGR